MDFGRRPSKSFPVMGARVKKALNEMTGRASEVPRHHQAPLAGRHGASRGFKV